MHAYVITAKPTRWQRAVHTARVWAVRALAAVGLISLGAVVFALRCARPVISVIATGAAWLEFEVSRRTGLPPLGAMAGAKFAAAFAEEFRTSWAPPPPDQN